MGNIHIQSASERYNKSIHNIFEQMLLMHQQYNSEKQTAQHLEKEKGHLAQDLTQLKELNNTLIGELETAQAEIKKLEVKMGNLKQENERINEKLMDSEKKNDTLDSDKDQLKAELDRVKREKKTMEVANERLIEKLADTNSKYTEAMEKITFMRQYLQ